MLWGIELEPVLAQVYAKRTGYRVRRVNAVLQHPSICFMLANLDQEVVGHPDGPGILGNQDRQLSQCPTGRRGAGRHQCRYCISWPSPAMPGREVAVLIGGQDFSDLSHPEREEKIRDLTERVAQFWQHQVNKTSSLNHDGSRMLAQCSGWLFPVTMGRPSISPILPNSTSCSNYCCICVEQRRKSSYANRRIKQRLQATLGEATAGLLPTAKITWKRSKDQLAPDLGPARAGSSRPAQPLRQTSARLTPFHPFKAVHAVRRHTHDQRTERLPRP